jgi:hypothetical protein
MCSSNPLACATQERGLVASISDVLIQPSDMRLRRGRDRGGGRTGGRTRRCTPDKPTRWALGTIRVCERGEKVACRYSNHLLHAFTTVEFALSVWSDMRIQPHLTSAPSACAATVVLKPNVHQIKHAASRCGLCGYNSHRKENIAAVAFHTPKASH